MNALIYLATAVLCGIYAVRTLARDTRDLTRRAYAVVAGIACLAFGGFGLYLVTGQPVFRYIHAGAGSFLPPAILWFLDRLLRGGLGGRPVKVSPWVARAWMGTGVAVALFIGLDLAVFGISTYGSPAELLLALLVQTGFGLCLLRLWLGHEAAEQRYEKVRLRYLIGLLAAATAFTSLEQLLRWLGRAEIAAGAVDLGPLARSVLLQGAFPPIGVVLATLFLYFLHQVVQLSRMLDLHEIFARLFTLAVASLVLVGIESVTVFQADALALYPAHGAFQVFLASALFLSVYDPLRRRIEALAGEWFNRAGRRLELTLQDVDRNLGRAMSLDGLGDELLERLFASGRVPLVSLYLWDHDRGAFRLALRRGIVEQPLMETIAGSPYTDGFQQGQAAYVRAMLERTVRRKETGHEEAAARLRTLDAMDADLSLCVRSGDLVVGWLNLKAEHWMDGFSREEVRRLSETVDRAAVLIENIYSFERLKEQHRLAALGTMAAGLAHEIRNPLAGIKGAAQYLQEVAEEADPEEVQDFAGVITREVDRLGSVVTQFLDYARPLSIRDDEMDPADLARRTVDLIERQALPEGLVLEVQALEGLPALRADADKIHQVLLNLIQNAIQALDGPGRICVQIAPAGMTRSGAGGGGRKAVEIRVIDDGPGIPPEVQSKLFIPFFTTRISGTGLGLAISRRIVEAHGGELVVRSKAGQGSTFTIRLPAEQDPPAALVKGSSAA